MQVLRVITSLEKGDYTCTLMGVDRPSHALINNHKTNKSSVLVPVSALRELLSEGIGNAI